MLQLQSKAQLGFTKLLTIPTNLERRAPFQTNRRPINTSTTTRSSYIYSYRRANYFKDF